MPEDVPRIVWQPDPEVAGRSRLAAFTQWLGAERGLPAADYAALHAWSVRDLEGFWGAVARFFGVRFHDPPAAVLTRRQLPGARWFPGATLNYAEHALAPGPGKAHDDVALVFRREDGAREELSYGALRAQVAAARAGLRALGVGVGDRVVALAPNCPQTLVAFLAAASLGAVWSSCSPDFGARAVHDRFSQIEPAVLIAVDGYVYNGRHVDVRPTVEGLRAAIPSLRETVLVPYTASALEGTLTWDELLGDRGAGLAFDAVPFDHPLWVLYSSGTTGLPKGIVQGHGGIVLEHLKSLALHCDLGPGERFFWFTTTGWMMWNLLVSGLLVGATVVAFDGSPTHPTADTLWGLAEAERVTYFGTSASFVQACHKEGLTPGADHDLSALRALGSTGSPLSPEGFSWIGEAVGERIQICSVSGGTDLCTAFVGSAPTVPVWLGEISCRCLGAAVEAFDAAGRSVVDEVGELVLTEPMPSMPVMFWNDPDGSRLRAAYFEDFPGVWRHGDWVRITPRGSCVIYGRSDSTLNRGGVRMGTAEFYRVVEGFAEVADSLVIDTSGARAPGPHPSGTPTSATRTSGPHPSGAHASATRTSGPHPSGAHASGTRQADAAGPEGELLCFLVLAPGAVLADVEPRLRSALRAELSPRHVPDRFVVIDEVPRTLNGKKSEVPVKRILTGTPVERAVSRDALLNPDALEVVCELARQAPSTECP